MPAGRRSEAAEQLARTTPVRIVLSSCQANPGDSGGPLVSPAGELLGVTHAIPAEVRTDKFVYHVHLDEVRAFLSRTPDAGGRDRSRGAQALADRPERAGAKTSAARAGFDALVAGTERPEQVLLDLDGEGEIPSADPPALERSSGRSPSTPRRRSTSRPTAGPRSTTPTATAPSTWSSWTWTPTPPRTCASRSPNGTWTVETGVEVPWLSTTWLGWLDHLDARRRQAARVLAIQKLRSIAR